MLKVSPSQISFLLECPRCLYLQFNENIKRPLGPFPSLPSGMDSIFKNYFDEFRKRGELPPELEGKVEGRLFQNLSKLNVWRNNFEGLKASFPELDIFLKGAVDDLLVTDDGKYIPLDFKTRGYNLKDNTHEHYTDQINLYALLFAKNNMPTYSKGYLLFFWPKKYEGKGVADFNFEVVEVDASPKEGYSLLKKVRKLLDGPMPDAHTDCTFCLFRSQTLNLENQ